MLVFAQGPGSWRVSESLLDRTHSNNYFPSCGSAGVSRTVSHAHAVSRSLLSLTLGSRSAHALPPSRSYRTLCLISDISHAADLRLALSCSHRATRALTRLPLLLCSQMCSQPLMLSAPLIFSFQLSRPTLVVSQLKFSQKSSNAHLILLRGRIE